MTDQAREAFEKRKSGQGYTHGELNTDPFGNYPYPGMQGDWVDFQFAYSAGLSAGREQAAQLGEALNEVLSFFPSDDTIHALEADDPKHARICPMRAHFYPTDKQVLKWRSIVGATQPEVQNEKV